jgi:predicted nucleic acid-binding protein
MIFICIDSGFLFALCDPTDRYHKGAPELFAELFEDIPAVLVVPWPILYETFNSHLVRRRSSIEELDRHFSRLRVHDRLQLVDDSPYRDSEFEATLSAVKRPPYRPLSLVDGIIRKMITDPELRIDTLLTLNAPDFRDVCLLARCEIVGWP